MNNLEKINKSGKLFYTLCAGIFLIMLALNLLTQMCVDDYTYTFSFAKSKPIENIFEIFPSIATHSHYFNGRSIAHFFAQLFLFLPAPVFKIINPLMFLLQIILIYKIAKQEKGHNNILLIAVFCLTWIFEPAFGQVNLWLDGSCNYLWSIVFTLAFIYPLTKELTGTPFKKNVGFYIGYIIISFIAGGYQESASAAAIFTVFVLMVLIKFYKKEKVSIAYLLGFLAAVVSFLIMAFAPAELSNKFGSHGIEFYMNNFVKALELFKMFWPLALIYVILAVTALYENRNKDKIILSALLFVAALCAHFILILASYQPERCGFCACILLIAADAVLTDELFTTRHQLKILLCVCSLMLITFYYGVIGSTDVYQTYKETTANINYIYECKEKGITDIELPMVIPETKYSSVYDLKYLDCEDVTSWPNSDMALYYGVNSIKGIYQEEN